MNFKTFMGKQLLIWLCRFIYKLGYYFFIYHSWYTVNFESTYKKPPFMKVDLFFR